jgi:uncharacterized protein
MLSNYYDDALKAAFTNESQSLVFEMLEKAASEKDCRAYYALSVCYFNGQFGISKNEKKGLFYLKKAARFNIAEAIFDLASHFDNRNDESVFIFDLYMRAALLGNKKACRQVSQFYREGKTVVYNKELAREWKKRSISAESLISPPWRISLEV